MNPNGIAPSRGELLKSVVPPGSKSFASCGLVMISGHDVPDLLRNGLCFRIGIMPLCFMHFDWTLRPCYEHLIASYSVDLDIVCCLFGFGLWFRDDTFTYTGHISPRHAHII
jgi:hypothetical protein